MTLVKTSAIVLRKIKWSDTSNIVALYTRELGRTDVIAKGARRTKSPYLGILEPLNFVDAIIYKSAKRELQTLGEVSLETSLQKIRIDMKKTGYAFSILELVNAFIFSGDDQQKFFDFLKYMLISMQNSDRPDILLWFFILKLTSYLGFRPQFSNCIYCQKTVQNEPVFFRFEDGAIICGKCESGHTGSVKISSITQKYLTDLQNTYYKKILNVMYPQNRDFQYTDFLATYLKYHTDQKLELKAIKFFT